MEATGNQTMKRALTPITDTSEEESNENTCKFKLIEYFLNNFLKLIFVLSANLQRRNLYRKRRASTRRK